MKRKSLRLIADVGVLLSLGIVLCSFVMTRQGNPWEDKIQSIPGQIECEFYDIGGEGLAYHDSDSINNGSGKLNPANGSFLNEFRMNEGVDISYTKGPGIDDTPYNKVKCEIGNLYVGWTQPGEWFTYTVKVASYGNYNIGAMYTSNGDATFSIVTDDGSESGALLLPTTYDAKDTVAWRQWHHWNKLSVGSIHLKKGVHTLRVSVLTHGNMNLDYLEFDKIRK